jgi:hypothetical protein
MPLLELLNKKQFVRVNFTNRGLSKIIKSEKSLSDTTPDKSSILQVANLLSDVKVVRAAPTTFKTLPEFLGIDYVGYIIEKERLNKTTGDWERIDEYKIIGAEANSFVDTRVAYGNSYRYRIKSILKLSKAERKVGLSHLELLEDIKKFEQNKFKQSLSKNKAVIDQLKNYVQPGLTSKTSLGKLPKEIKLSDTVSLKVTESLTDLFKKNVSVNDNLRLLKNLKVESLDFAKGSVKDVDFQKLINKNLQKFKEQKIEYVSCYFESNPSKNWIYVDIVENVPPPPPHTIKITPCTPKREILVSWLPPANSQRDIKYFKIYRRGAVGDKWTLMTKTGDSVDIDGDGVLDVENTTIPRDLNLFVDRNVQVGRPYIYALTSVDVHGTESFLSTQIQAELNSNYALEKEEKKLKWISGSGAKPEEIDFVLKKFFNRTEQIVAKRNIVLSPNTKFAETEKNLIIKITSLDTHEVKELKVVLTNNNVKEK